MRRVRNDEHSTRPSPDAVLAVTAQEGRARLKLFVGAAPGVGKTFAMLEAAQALRREGRDVVVGIVETHGRRETEALLAGLEVVPRQSIPYREGSIDELDLDAVLRRRPAVVLVDELAHTNAPGSRHPKRWLDVEELLDAGIAVFSAVNIQHLESLNDVVAQITGVRVRETVPDRVVDRADEVKLIDISPEELMQRLSEGKVYVPREAERALRNYFRPGNLTALRELALRRTAAHVDDRMEAYMRAHAVEGPWPVAERVMVAVRGGALSERLVRAARRAAARRNTPWLAVFVETPGFPDRPDAERERVATVLRLAEQLGGESVTIAGTDIGTELLAFARDRNVTELIIGRPSRGGWHRWTRTSLVDQVVRSAGAIDVRVVSGEDPAPAAARWQDRVVATPVAYGRAVAAVAAAALLTTGFMRVLPLQDPGVIFLAAVFLTAVLSGLGPSIAASVLSVLTFDYLFTEPYYSLTVTDPQDVLSLVLFLSVAILTSNLTARIRDQTLLARRRESRTAALYAFSRAIATAASTDELLRGIVEHVAGVLGSDTVLLLGTQGRLLPQAAVPPSATLSEAELATGTWAWEHDEPAGRGTNTLPGGHWLYVPLRTVRGSVGVVGVRADLVPSFDQRQMLETLAGQAAIAIERTRIDAVLEAQAKTEAVIESIEDGLIVLDPEGIILNVNEVACAILDVEHQHAVGRPFDDLGSDHPHYLRLRTTVRGFVQTPHGELDAVELKLFLRGRDHAFVLRPTPYRTMTGVRAGMILVLQDVTYLRDQDAQREQMLATLSHELRTPLTSLRMATELMGRGAPPLDDERTRLLGTAHDDIDRLADVTSRLVELSRSRAATISLERQPVELSRVAERTRQLFALQARERGVTLEVRPCDDSTIVGDETKITWVLSNLVANALRYTPRAGRVGVHVEASDAAVKVAVSDTGQGIQPELRTRIFEPFVQGLEGEPGATGLGLAIVRDIVQAHGGRIHLDSEVGQGSTFTCEFPRA